MINFNSIKYHWKSFKYQIFKLKEFIKNSLNDSYDEETYEIEEEPSTYNYKALFLDKNGFVKFKMCLTSTSTNTSDVEVENRRYFSGAMIGYIQGNEFGYLTAEFMKQIHKIKIIRSDDDD